MKPELTNEPDRSEPDHLTNADARSSNDGTKMQFVQMNPLNSKYKETVQ